MQFVTILALAIGLLVAAPYLAHRLRRRQADERAFPPAHLVPAALPKARRRSALEDKALFSVRTAAVIALALLGATPLVRCSRLSLARGGASVAMVLVLDDSMSMRAKDGSRTRFERAREGAREILASAQEGDAVAVIMAGAPPRIALAPTSDIDAAKSAVDAAVESDRATDLDGAIAMAEGLLQKQPHVDKRAIVFSDRADGRADAPVLVTGIRLWFAMPDLAKDSSDCALIEATRSGALVRTRVQCNHASAFSGREIVIMAGGKKIASSLGPPGVGAGDAPLAMEPTLQLTPEAAADPHDLVAQITGSDAIATDDLAAVVTQGSPGALAVVSYGRDEAVATGGPPVIEQALAALKTGVPATPLPVVPDRSEDLAPFAGLLVDDPPGLTPEERRALGSFLDNGGLVLMALGPRAASPPLGASLLPVLTQPVRWGPTTVAGIDPKNTGFFGESGLSLENVEARGRTTLADDDQKAFEVRAAWKDGAPLLVKRAVGRGEVWVVTLPLSADESDFPLRPAFLTLLDAFAAETISRASPQRTEVGVPWLLRGKKVEGKGPVEGADPSKGGPPLTLLKDGPVSRIVPGMVGAYVFTIDGKPERRVVSPAPREVDFRPRKVPEAALDAAEGNGHPKMDVSWVLALVLLALFAAELGMRAFFRSRTENNIPPVSVR